MTLKHTLKLLTQLEAAGKLEPRSLPTLYDPNGDITLTVRAVDVATREQFLADAYTAEPVDPEPEAVVVTPHAKATVAAKTASKKAAKK